MRRAPFILVATFAVACRAPSQLPAPSNAPRAERTPSESTTGWRPSRSTLGITFHDSIGDPRVAAPYIYLMRAAAGSTVGVHRHLAEMRIRVVRGRKFLLMGNPPESQPVRVVRAGETLVIPAGMWHVEWWEEDTLEEISGTGPLQTEHPPAAVPSRP